MYLKQIDNECQFFHYFTEKHPYSNGRMAFSLGWRTGTSIRDINPNFVVYYPLIQINIYLKINCYTENLAKQHLFKCVRHTHKGAYHSKIDA